MTHSIAWKGRHARQKSFSLSIMRPCTGDLGKLGKGIVRQILRALRATIILLILVIVTVSPTILVLGQQQIPFDGLMLTYYSETTQILQERTGIHASWWTTLLFHNVSATYSKMDINVNGTITQNDKQRAENFSITVNFPKNQDTLVYLRNGGQDNLTIYAGPPELTIPSIPGLTVNLTRSWNLHDKPLIRTPLGAFSGYRYHTGIKSIQLPNGDMLDLDFYTSYEMKSQVLMAGEVWATINGSSVMIAQTQVRAANVFSGQPNPTSFQCLIATATYGSAFAPQVQFLRDFRDQKIDKTFAGYSFMTAFSLWYYSFSPAVGGAIDVSPQLQNMMQILLYPLIVILQLSAGVFDAFSFQPELAAVLAGLVATALLGIVYLWIPSIMIRRRFKNEIKRALKPLATILGAATIALAGSEIFGNSLIAVTSSVVLVLANLLLFAALPGIFPNPNSLVHRLTKRRA
jgi:hypothetical protein